MKSIYLSTLALLLVIFSIIPFTSCESTSELIPNNPVKAEASTGDYEAMSARINELEQRVEYLEQGLNERVIEYHMVQSAMFQMIVDKGSLEFLDSTGDRLLPTNDMRLFPKKDSPLYGFDKNKDGIPDTNYFPYANTKWYYQWFDGIPWVMQYPVLDWGNLSLQGANVGQLEAYEVELHNIQTAVMAMMADAATGNLLSTGTVVAVNGGSYVLDLHTVTAEGIQGEILYLDHY
ncbi:MAG: hypothetical protein ACFFDI_32855, partial [Promethearchaeota archaeon]